MRVRVPGRAVMCLLAASLCELVVAGVSLALLPGLEAELEMERKAGGSLGWEMLALSKAQTLLWLHTAAGVVTPALAALVALAWRRGGAAGARTVMAVGLVPYTALCYHLGWEAMDMAGSAGGLARYSYEYLAFSLANTAWLLYLAGTILLFSSGANTHQADRRSVPL
ncbi:hypothetical protein [Streptosporangium sp. NPDC049644]|uniref:hypothetical protein n=1 Tax=Streptosporangium sp. NPDC049644 TaxID=3155507 RepID=UPI0034341282